MQQFLKESVRLVKSGIPKEVEPEGHVYGYVAVLVTKCYCVCPPSNLP